MTLRLAILPPAFTIKVAYDVVRDVDDMLDNVYTYRYVHKRTTIDVNGASE